MTFLAQTRPNQQAQPQAADVNNQSPEVHAATARKAPLKTHATAWTRTFAGQGGGVSFEVKIQRDPSGHLHGRYMTRPGNPTGWHLEGQIREDNTFALKGTQNQALFEGSFDALGITLTTTFRNKDFQVEKLQLKRQQGKIPLNTNQQTGPSGSSQQNSDVKHWTQTLTPEMRKRLPALAEPQFLPTLEAMCKRLNIPVDMLLAVMTFESADAKRKTRGLDPQADNGLGYYGLIQFGKSAADDLGIPDGAKGITKLTATQQLVYVEKYLKSHGLQDAQQKAQQEGRQISLEELYMSVLGGHTRLAYKPFWKSKTANPSGYRNNIGLDSNRDGKITATEAADMVRLHWRDVYSNNLDERSRHLERSKDNSVIYHQNIYSRTLNTAGIQGTASPGPQSQPDVTAAGKEPGALDRLMGLKQETTTYSMEQINDARALIMTLPSAQRPPLFLELQAKVQYHNQRNNQAVENGARVETPGGEMCNVTSLAMVLETVGIGIPKTVKEHEERCKKNAPAISQAKLSGMQYEDYLELIRQHYRLGPRTYQNTLGRIARKMGASWELMCPVGENTFWKRTTWQEKAGGALGSGSGVMFSVGGHIVRLQGMSEDGLIVDDPYGDITLFAGDRFKFDDTNNVKNSAVGSNQVWPWDEVENHVLWWMARVSKA